MAIDERALAKVLETTELRLRDYVNVSIREYESAKTEQPVSVDLEKCANAVAQIQPMLVCKPGGVLQICREEASRIAKIVLSAAGVKYGN